MDGKLIDFDRVRRVARAGGGRAPAGLDRAVRAELGIEPALPELNGAQRQRARSPPARRWRRSSPTSVQRDPADLRRRRSDRHERRQQPAASRTEEELRAAYEAQLESSSVAARRGRRRADDRLAAEPRRPQGRPRARAPRTSATPSRCASRSRAPARCCRLVEPSSAPTAPRSATRCPSSSWPTRSWPAARGAGAPAARRRRSEPGGQPASPSGAGPAQSSGRLWVPGQ